MEEEFTPQTVECSKCGKVLYEGQVLKPIDQIIKSYKGKCPSCGKLLGPPSTMEEETKTVTMKKSISTKKPSKLWYLLPIFLTWLGGIIGYILVKNRDQKFARRLLIVGLILTAVFIAIGVILFLLGVSLYFSGISVS